MLVSSGMVATHENPNHQRARLVLFTKKGRAAYDETVAIQVEWANETAAGFSESELSTALRNLRSLHARLETTKKRNRGARILK
jgi:DNA-binding MarR family transcriptional regulator